MSAQEQQRGEFAFHAGLAGSTFKFFPPMFDADKDLADMGFGGNLGLETTFFLYADFGISIGAEVALYNSSMSLSSFFNKQPAPTPSLPGYDNNVNYFYCIHYEGIKDSRRAVLLQVPVMLHYQYPMADLIECITRTNDYLYAGAGVKAGLPLTATYTQSIAAKTVAVYDGTVIHGNISEMGFPDPDMPESGEAAMSKAYIIPSVEVGYKMRLANNKRMFSAGFYCDFGYAAGLKVSYIFGWGSQLPSSARLFKKK